MSIYEVLSRVIARGNYDANMIGAMMQLFLEYGQLSQDQFNELTAATHAE